MARRLSPLIMLAALGCKTTSGPPVVYSDVRIDEAPNGVDPESEETRMCVNESGHIFVVWVDDRDGQRDVWLNRSMDAGGSWMPAPVKVNHGEGEVFAPAIACTADSVFVVWEDQRDGELLNHNIYFNRSEGNSEQLGLEWQGEDTRIDLDEDGFTMSLGPSIAAVGSDVYISWFDSVNGAYDILFAHSDNGGRTWPVNAGEYRRLDSDGEGDAYSAWPNMVATDDGDIYVVWEDSRGNDASSKSDIYFAASENNGQTWSNDVRLDKGDSRGQNSSFAPQIGADRDNIYVVWHDERNGDARDIFMNYSPDFGGNWFSAAERVETDNPGFFDSRFPTVIVDGDTAHIAWSDKSTADGGYDVYYRQAVQGSLQGEMVQLNRDPTGYFNHTGVRMAMTDEHLLVAWQDYRDDNTNAGYNDLYYNYSIDRGATWNDKDLRIDSMEPGQAFKIDFNFDVYESDIVASWTDGRNGTSDIYFNVVSIGEAGSFLAASE